MLISASTYWSPFCSMEMSAAGGTSVPLMLDWLMWLSMPKVNAEWEKPETQRRRSRLQTVTCCVSEEFPTMIKYNAWTAATNK